MNAKLQGLWSTFGLLAILLFATLTGGVSYGELLTNVGAFLLGNLNAVPLGANENLFTQVLNIAAIIVMMIVAAYAVGLVTNQKTKSYAMEEMERMLERGPWLLFVVVLVEEIIARWLFVGVIAQWIGGTVAFYICFIAGNAIWALVHLSNYKSESEKSPLRVIPQFVGGLFLTYVFVRYGFWVALMTHYLYNLVLLASFKKQRVGQAAAVRLGYYLILLAGSALAAGQMGISVTSISPWLNGQMVPLDSFGFWQYLVILLLIGSAVDAIAELLLLDVVKPTEESAQLLMKPGLFVFGVVFFTTLILGGNWLLTVFRVDDPLTRALILTVVASLISSAKSGSAIARTTLVNMPSTYFMVVAFTVLGLWPAVGLTVILLAMGYVPLALNILFDDE